MSTELRGVFDIKELPSPEEIDASIKSALGELVCFIVFKDAKDDDSQGQTLQLMAFVDSIEEQVNERTGNVEMRGKVRVPVEMTSLLNGTGVYHVSYSLRHEVDGENSTLTVARPE